ncbi:hypothetical protein ACWDBD_17580 [Streptomyces sp. NPDC001118]
MLSRPYRLGSSGDEMGRTVMTESSCILPSLPDLAREGWEAIRVGRYYGLQALARLHAPGAVAIDPSTTPGVCFFVQAGSAAKWPQASAISVMTDFEPPPAARQTPPGTYWLVPPRGGTLRLTDEGALFIALTEVIPDWAEAAS